MFSKASMRMPPSAGTIALIVGAVLALSTLSLLPRWVRADKDPPPARDLNEPPVCTFIPELKYPAVADSSQSGLILVKVYLDEKGRMVNTEVLEASLPELFVLEALRATGLSRFEPALHQGKPINSSLIMPFQFHARAVPAKAAPPAVATPLTPAPPPRASAAPAEEDRRNTEPAEAAPLPPPAGEGAARESPASARAPALGDPNEGEVLAAETALPEETARPNDPIAAAATGESGLRVAEAAFGQGVNNRLLEGRAEAFREGERVYCYSRILGGAEGEIIKHIWIFRDREVQAIELSVKSDDWRTWSYKTLFPGLAGDWTVEIRDGDDRPLGRFSFVCQP